jgi:hypothetical protein
MSNILKAKVKIKGVRPLFFHKFGPEALPLEAQEKTGRAGNDPEEWRKTVMVTKDGQLFVEPTYVFATLRGGAKYTKKGKGSIQPALAATLQVVDNRVLINRYLPGFPNGHACDPKAVAPPAQDSDAPVYLDIRGVVNPTTKARNVRYRIAASPGWECEFTVAWDKTIVSRGEMEAVLRDAGTLVGIGNGRAIGMGRFEVASFEVVE